MPPATWNPITGRKRRRAVRYHNYMNRASALDAKDELCLTRIHAIAARIQQRKRRLLLLSALFLAHGNVNNQARNRHLSALALTLCLIQNRKLRLLQTLDSFVGDMTIQEEQEPKAYRPKRFTRINHFVSDDDARIHTSFTKQQLQTILQRFAFPTNGDGMVVVTWGHGASQRNYHFHPEEMLIYYLIRATGGFYHTQMASAFGTTDQNRRWSPGCRWLVMYLDQRYRNILGVNGLRRFVPRFPEFAAAIERKANEENLYYNPLTDQWVETDGAGFAQGDCAIALWHDGVFFPTCKPLSGPDGDYVGAMRRLGGQNAQRMIYGNKGHGVLILSFFLPNGIHFYYGPVSARRNELQVLNWSAADDLLFQVQNATLPRVYSSYGDKLFSQGHWRCIKAARQGVVPNDALHQQEKNLNRSRIGIEWDFGRTKSRFKLAMQRDNFKLAHDPQYKLAEFRVLGLLKNIHACFNGTAANAPRTFAIDPPTIDDYLVPVGDPVPNPVTNNQWWNL